MNYKTLTNRRIVDKYTQLLRSTSYDFSAVAIESVFVVPADLAYRPTAIAHKTTGNSNNADMICKFNGIKNPFSIAVDTTLYIPNADDYFNAIESMLIKDAQIHQYIQQNDQSIATQSLTAKQHNVPNIIVNATSLIY
jgi:hypothetical protein